MISKEEKSHRINRLDFHREKHARGQRGEAGACERGTLPAFCLLSDTLSSTHTFLFGKLWAHFRKQKKMQGCLILQP